MPLRSAAIALFLTLFLAAVWAQRGDKPAAVVRHIASSEQTDTARAYPPNEQEKIFRAANDYEQRGKLQEAAWLYAEYGDHAKADALLVLLEQLMRRQPSEIRFLGGGNTCSYLFTYPDGMKAVFKPSFNEHYRYRHEVAAYAVDRMLNLNIAPMALAVSFEVSALPECPVREKSGGMASGSLTYFVSDSKTVGAKFNSAGDKVLKLTHLAIFDMLINNPDRHRDNWLIHDSGKVVAIDHDTAFLVRPPGAENPFTGNIHTPHDPRKLLPYKDALQGLPELERVTDEQWKAALAGLLTQEEFEGFLERKRVLLRTLTAK